MSPVSMTKPYFVSECRVGGFIRTLLSGLVRSIKTMLQILSFLTVQWTWIFQFIPRMIRDAIYDAIYDLVARNRGRWFGRRDACITLASCRIRIIITPTTCAGQR